MKTDFLLYLDILGFEQISTSCDPKVELIYTTLLETKKRRDSTYKVVIFSDTVLVQNIGLEDPLYSLMYLCEFFIVLQYKLSKLSMFLRGVIYHGHYTMENREGVEVFWGPAINAAYRAEKVIKAVGLFMHKNCLQWNGIHRLTPYNENYSFVQTLLGVVAHIEYAPGGIEVDKFVLQQTDYLCHLVDDVKLLNQFSYLRHHAENECIREKHEATWQLIRVYNALLLDALEKENFDLCIVNDEYEWPVSGMYD